MKIYAVLDWSILFLVGIFLIGLGITEYKTLGLQGPLVETSPEWESFFVILIWPIIGLLLLDIAIKYNATRNPKKFLKKYWIDIAMLALIPVFSLFKFFKLGISIVKKLKTAKMGAKAIHKTKKMIQR